MLNTLKIHLAPGAFTTITCCLSSPGRSWKQAFYQAVRDAARALGIQVSGVHRLRANCFQNTYEDLIEEGWDDKKARQKISKDAGHNRVEVTYNYAPKRD